MKQICLFAVALCIASCMSGCAAPFKAPIQNEIGQTLAAAATERPAPPPIAPEPEIKIVLPPEPRISLSLSNVPARQFFMALAADTEYSMLIHPDISGNLSARLQDVTVPEAMEVISDLYDLDYSINGRRISIRQPALQTKVFQVNYLTGSRKGSSDTRVSAGSLVDTPVAGAVPAPNRIVDSSRVSTASDTDFWNDVKAALNAIVNTTANGRSIVISPQSGVLVVRAMPKELRDISAYLKATKISVERQVILEAKIIEVQLSDSFQTGINWAGFGGGGTRISAGVLQPGTSLSPVASNTALTGGGISALAGADLAAAASAGGTLFGLALQGSSFASLITFLETQGMVQVLSSPRIATMNNQKAVLKIGIDDFFVTGVSGGTTTPAAGGAITTTPNVTLRPFFSGVVLDVLPQIDGEGNIILHIRPSVSQVSTVNKVINLGVGGQLTLPLASSSASEVDSVVRARNGQMIVLGGLMRQSGNNERSQVPGLGSAAGIGALFGNTARANQKRELVILLKPTVILDDQPWAEDLQQTRQRVQQLQTGQKERKAP